MSSVKLFALSSLQVLLHFMLCPISKICSITAHSPSGPDVGIWYAPCFWFLQFNQSVQHATCCTWMRCSVDIGSLLGFNNAGISLSVRMFLLTVPFFILFYPEHLFYQFLVYGCKPFLYCHNLSVLHHSKLSIWSSCTSMKFSSYLVSILQPPHIQLTQLAWQDSETRKISQL